MLHRGGDGLATARELAVTEVVLHHHTADRYTELRPEAPVLDIDRDSDAWLGARSKADEGRVSLPVGDSLPYRSYHIPRSHLGRVCSTTRTARDSASHPCDDILPILAGDPCGLVIAVHRVQRHTADGVHDVRADVVAAVGYEGGEIRYLQGRGEHFPLPDGDGDDGVAVPCALVELICRRPLFGIYPRFSPGQVDTEAIAETEGDHTLLPVLQCDGLPRG